VETHKQEQSDFNNHSFLVRTKTVKNLNVQF
jgi:hypothetical protein